MPGTIFHPRLARLMAFCVVGALSLTFSGQTNATPILQGNTAGTNFSGYSGFTSASATELIWNAGTLTIDPLTFSATGATTGLNLAELVMTVDNNPAVTGSFNYNVVLNITNPSLGPSTFVFPLDVSATGTGVSSSNSVSNLVLAASLPSFPASIDLGNGYALTDFAFGDLVASGSNADTSTSFSGGDWSLTGHSEGRNGPAGADLFLTADVVALTGVSSQDQSVPEPASAAFFGTAIGMGWLLRRRRR